MTLSFFIQTHLALFVLAVLYKLLLADNVHLLANRFVLLALPLFSLLIPYLATLAASTPILSLQLPTLEIGFLDTNSPITPRENSLKDTLLLGYGLISLLGFSWLIVGTIRMITAPSQYHKTYRNTRVYTSNHHGDTYSFLNRIYLAETHIDSEHILHHEYAHVIQKHSIDRMFYGILKALFWVNPAIYILAKELKTNHEYSADLYAIRQAENKNAYLETLTANALGTSRDFLIANHFRTPSLLASRIKMLQKSNFKHPNIMKHLTLIPLCLLMILGFTLINPDNAKAQNEKQTDAPQNMTPPKFPGGNAAFQEYIAENLKYPKTLQEEGGEGTVFVTFSVTKKGKVKKAKVKKGVNPSLDAAAMQIFKNMPNWVPATKDGKPIKFQMYLPLKFQIKP